MLPEIGEMLENPTNLTGIQNPYKDPMYAKRL